MANNLPLLVAMSEHPLSAAVASAGGVTALCKSLGISVRTYSSWRNGVPAVRVISVSEATGISPAKLNPDLAAAFASAAP
jgi:DNA-binding transcriptional regulator YdaS (Cro superfamily)